MIRKRNIAFENVILTPLYKMFQVIEKYIFKDDYIKAGFSRYNTIYLPLNIVSERLGYGDNL